MKTNYLPALIMLCAGFVDCLLAIRNHLGLRNFIIELLAVLVIFYVIGIVIKFVLDKNFKAMAKDSVETAAQSEETVENIDVDTAEQKEEKE